MKRAKKSARPNPSPIFQLKTFFQTLLFGGSNHKFRPEMNNETNIRNRNNPRFCLLTCLYWKTTLDKAGRRLLR
ncbi:MAG: hypothetical protein AAF412_13000, partial [Pseudomonadota bacterium]